MWLYSSLELLFGLLLLLLPFSAGVNDREEPLKLNCSIYYTVNHSGVHENISLKILLPPNSEIYYYIGEAINISHIIPYISNDKIHKEVSKKNYSSANNELVTLYINTSIIPKNNNLLIGCIEKRECGLWKTNTDGSMRVTEIPWAVRLMRNGKFICGGTFISQRHVLSGAHCKEIQENFEEFSAEFKNITIKIEEVIVHPEYNASLILNDIAIFKLENHFPQYLGITPICLSAQTLDYNKIENIMTLYWKTSDNETKLSEHNPEINLKIDDSCQNVSKITNFSIELSSDIICTRKTDELCFPYSPGSPLVFRQDNRVIQIGISVWAVICDSTKNDSDLPGAFQKVAPHIKWIQNITDNEVGIKGLSI